MWVLILVLLVCEWRANAEFVMPGIKKTTRDVIFGTELVFRNSRDVMVIYRFCFFVKSDKSIRLRFGYSPT